MNQAINSYRRRTIKSLLVAVYLLFFVAHLNGRYYSVANFYVYGKSNLTALSRVTALGSPYQDRVHLSLDKRFHGQQFFNAILSTAEFELSANRPVVTLSYPVVDDAPIQPDKDPRCLRGPPSLTQV